MSYFKDLVNKAINKTALPKKVNAKDRAVQRLGAAQEFIRQGQFLERAVLKELEGLGVLNPKKDALYSAVYQSERFLVQRVDGKYYIIEKGGK